MSVDNGPAQKHGVFTRFQYLTTLIAMFVPGIGLVLMFKWGFGKPVHPTRRKLARIGLVISSFALVIYYYAAKYMITLQGH